MGRALCRLLRRLRVFFTACVAAYEAVLRLIESRDVEHLGALAVAGLIGCGGHWLAAILRTNAGRTLDSRL